MKLTKLLFLIPLIILILHGSGCKRKSIEQLLQQGKIDTAQRRCEKKKPEEKSDCYKTIALFYLKKNQYKKAAMYYAKAGDHIKVINSYFQGNLVPEAEKYCADQTGEAKKQCAARLGRKFFIKENYNKAIQYHNIAGEKEKILYIETKIPVFQLVDHIRKNTREMKDSKVSGKLTAIKNALTVYIYMEKYHKWPYHKKSGPYKLAAGIYEDALNMLENKVMPTFVNTLNNSNFDWSEKSVQSLAFDHFKMESLINLIKNLHHIADKREFFTKYSVVYQDKSKKVRKEPHQSLNYEEAYMKALDHSRMLLGEIAEANGVKNKEWLQDYQHNMTIDMKVIEYIASMVNNVKARIDDIHRRSQRLQKTSKDEAVKRTVEKLFWDFVAQCNQVLHLISKEKYQEANDLLISGYETAKNAILRYTGRSVGQ